MRFYADRTAYRSRQIVADLVWLVCVVASVLAGRAVHGAIAQISGPARRIAEGSTGLADRLRDAATAIQDAPLVGDEVAGALFGSGEEAMSLARTATDQAEQVLAVATLLGVLTAVLPILLVTAVRLRQRLRWVRRTREAMRLSQTPEGERILALRALQHRRAEQLFAVHPDPASAWKNGEVTEELAALERRALGLGG